MLCSTERVLEEDGDTIAPPARPLPTKRTSLLPERPAMLVTSTRVRQGTTQPNDINENDDGNDRDAKTGVTEEGDTEDEDNDTAPDYNIETADDDADIDADADNDADGHANTHIDTDADIDIADDADVDADVDADIDADNADVDVDVDTGNNTIDTSHLCTPNPQLQGASRTTGGILHGRAAGNVFNIGDAVHVTANPEVQAVASGRVLVYDNNAADADPLFSMKHAITTDLKPILRRLADKYSPVRSELSDIISYLSHKSVRV
jgi:hypothetical protein